MYVEFLDETKPNQTKPTKKLHFVLDKTKTKKERYLYIQIQMTNGQFRLFSQRDSIRGTFKTNNLDFFFFFFLKFTLWNTSLRT